MSLFEYRPYKYLTINDLIISIQKAKEEAENHIVNGRPYLANEQREDIEVLEKELAKKKGKK